MPDEVGGNSLTNMTDLELLEDENVDGVPCFKIQGKYTSGRVRTLWIEKESYLILKTLRSSGRSETTTTKLRMT